MKVMLRPDIADAAEGLSHSKKYEVIGIEADDYRILNDDGSPVLYAPGLFVATDAGEPEEWVKTLGDDGELYAYPPELDAVGFWEDYHDGNEYAIRVFRDYLRARGIEKPGILPTVLRKRHGVRGTR